MDSPAIGSKTEAADSESSPIWLKRVPMITGVLAGLAGYLTVRGANLSNEAIYRSNQAVLFQSQASDKWAQYQADSVKARIVETAMITATDDKVGAKLKSDEEKFRTQQTADKADAQAFENDRDRELLNSHTRLGEKDLLDYAGVATQLGIALASVAALTRKKAAFQVGVGAGAVAIAVTAYALFNHFFNHG